MAEDAFASYDDERGNINATLNFVVPAALMTGLLRFTVDVESPFSGCPGNNASGSTTANVNLQQTLNAAFITIGYNGPNATNTGNIVLPAPTLATCQAETSWAVEWFIDDKAVGKGFDLWVETPGVGRHRLRMQVTEGALTGVAGNEFEVIGDGEPAKSD